LRRPQTWALSRDLFREKIISKKKHDEGGEAEPRMLAALRSCPVVDIRDVDAEPEEEDYGS